VLFFFDCSVCLAAARSAAVRRAQAFFLLLSFSLFFSFVLWCIPGFFFLLRSKTRRERKIGVLLFLLSLFLIHLLAIHTLTPTHTCAQQRDIRHNIRRRGRRRKKESQIFFSEAFPCTLWPSKAAAPPSTASLYSLFFLFGTLSVIYCSESFIVSFLILTTEKFCLSPSFVCACSASTGVSFAYLLFSSPFFVFLLPYFF
jgi:hypothetical protein